MCQWQLLWLFWNSEQGVPWAHIDSKCDSSCHCGIQILMIGQLIERSASSRTLWALYQVAGPLLFRATFAITWNKQVMRIIQLSLSAPWGLLIVCVHVLEFLSMCEPSCHSIFFHSIFFICHHHTMLFWFFPWTTFCFYIAAANTSLFLFFVLSFYFQKGWPSKDSFGSTGIVLINIFTTKFMCLIKDWNQSH